MWTFQIATGTLLKPDGSFFSKGYAGGNKGKNPEGRNNAAMCGVKDIGPLPKGLYTMGEPVEGSHLGPFAIPLTPDPANEMFGRGDFFIHGDTVPSGNASEGCLIVPRMVRQLMKASDDQKIQVI